LILKFVEHLSNAEIGEIMGRSEGAVKSLYHRTLISLRDEYLGIKSISAQFSGDNLRDSEIEGNWR
jgi:DNA-directed RNA polymerase specialized sigma24 family protein